MLVSAKEMLDKAVEGHYAVGQFNIKQLRVDKIYSPYSRRVKVTSYLRCI